MTDQILTFVNKLEDIKNKFESLINKVSNDIELSKKNHSLNLNRLQEDFKGSKLKISEKLDYLNAEIFRYGELLKKDFKLSDLTGVLKERFQELEFAVAEYVSLKIREHDAEHKTKISDFKENFEKSQNELLHQKTLFEEEFQDKVETFLHELEQFRKDQLDSNKSYCNPASIKQFESPTFDNTSGSITIGEKNHVFSASDIKKEIRLPEIEDFRDYQNFIIVYDDSSKEKAESISDVLIFRLLMSHLPDKIKIHIYDKSMNEKFREFLSIPSSVIEKGFEWNHFLNHLDSAESIVRSKLGLIWSDIGSDHNSLHQYNLKLIKEDKFDDILPYYYFVMDDVLSFPFEQNIQQTFERLDKLLQYGCNSIFLVKNDGQTEKKNSFIDAAIKYRNKIIDFTGEYSSMGINANELIIENIVLEDKKIIISNFLNSLNNLNDSRSKIKFKAYSIPEKTTWFKQKAASEVKVPIGKSQSKEGFEFLSFKTKDMLSNALLCGGVGSGKTNFLKSVITSLSLNYSPEEIELWLVDMKNGAGFSIFNNCQLPHATKYAFSAESELINDLFFQLKKEMEERYSYFSQFSVDNLEDAKKLENVDPSKLRRIVLVIDEFATIFTEDAAFLDEISANLLSIIQKGRAMGINLLLAAQNFNNIRNASFNQAVTLIPTRILLKSSPEAATSVLGYSNKGSIEITKIGQGLINNNFGEINNDGGNFYFKSFIIDNEDLQPILEEIKLEVTNQKLKTSSVKFIDASLPAKFETNQKLFSQSVNEDYNEVFQKNGLDCFMGESYLMNEDNHFSFKWKINGRQSIQNILLTGNEREHSTQALLSILSSLSYGVPKVEISIKWLNAIDDDTIKDLSLDLNYPNLTNYDLETFSIEQLEDLICGLENVMNNRRSSKDRVPVITFLVGVEKLLKLHSANYSESDLTARLKVIMSTGSNYGIYFVCEINKPSNLDKISRDLTGFFEHRICYFMNADESNYLINSKAASQLISMDAPNIRNKAIYFSQSEAYAIKFKSYENIHVLNSFIRPLPEKLDFGYKIANIKSKIETTTDKVDDDKLDLGEIGNMSLDSFSDILK